MKQRVLREMQLQRRQVRSDTELDWLCQFLKFDAGSDGTADGVLSEAEMHRLLASLRLEDVPVHELQFILDVDANGEVSPMDWLSAMWMQFAPRAPPVISGDALPTRQACNLPPITL